MEGPPPPMMITVNEEVMGLLRRLVGALERGAEALEVTESRYQKMDERERKYKRMDEQGWVERQTSWRKTRRKRRKKRRG